jgi:hypothetical protein
MAKSKQPRRARNKIDGAAPRALVKADSFAEAGAKVDLQQQQAVRIVRSSLFTAELEEIIDIVARERVRREMLARLERRLLIRPTSNGDEFDA